MKNRIKYFMTVILINAFVFALAQNNQKKRDDGTIFDDRSEVPVSKKISCPNGTIMTNGRCVPQELLKAKWLDLETGQIKYFEYTEDTPIANPAICKALNLDACVILKGKYMVDRSDGFGGKMTLRIAPVKWINRPPIPEVRAFAFEGTNPRGQSCSGFGNSCWYAKAPVKETNAARKLPFFITPIVTEGVCSSIVVQWEGVNPVVAKMTDEEMGSLKTDKSESSRAGRKIKY